MTIFDSSNLTLSCAILGCRSAPYAQIDIRIAQERVNFWVSTANVTRNRRPSRRLTRRLGQKSRIKWVNFENFKFSKFDPVAHATNDGPQHDGVHRRVVAAPRRRRRKPLRQGSSSRRRRRWLTDDEKPWCKSIIRRHCRRPSSTSRVDPQISGADLLTFV